MMAILKSIIILAVAVSCSHSLAAWVKYPAKGTADEACALPDGRILSTNMRDNHFEMCGEYLCYDTSGTTVIVYCQTTLPFQECNETGVDTYKLFPECCFECVYYTDC